MPSIVCRLYFSWYFVQVFLSSIFLFWQNWAINNHPPAPSNVRAKWDKWMSFENCKVLNECSVINFWWNIHLGGSRGIDIFILLCKPLLGHPARSEVLETCIWKTKCNSLVKLKGTGCLLPPNLPDFEFSSPLFFSLCAHHLQFYWSSLCFAWESVKGEEYLPPRPGPEWKFVNNKNAVFVFQIKHHFFFSNVRIYRLFLMLNHWINLLGKYTIWGLKFLSFWNISNAVDILLMPGHQRVN